MDEFSPTTSAADEVQQRIDVLTKRVETWHPEQVAYAQEQLDTAKQRMAEDEQRLRQWRRLGDAIKNETFAFLGD